MMFASTPDNQKYMARAALMLTRVQRVKLGADATLTLCVETLQSKKYQTTIFGARRLLCVKRSQQAGCTINLEFLIEAFSHYETKITICGNLSDSALQWEVIGEVFGIADQLVENSKCRAPLMAAFPINALQVCIV